jgi:hypothetical protein
MLTKSKSPNKQNRNQKGDRHFLVKHQIKGRNKAKDYKKRLLEERKRFKK